MTSTQKTGEPSENKKKGHSIQVIFLFCFLHVHPFFVVYPIEGQMRQAFFEVSLHFGQSWPTVRRTSVRQYDEISTIYIYFKQSQQSRQAEIQSFDVSA